MKTSGESAVRWRSVVSGQWSTVRCHSKRDEPDRCKQHPQFVLKYFQSPSYNTKQECQSVHTMDCYKINCEENMLSSDTIVLSIWNSVPMNI